MVHCDDRKLTRAHATHMLVNTTLHMKKLFLQVFNYTHHRGINHNSYSKELKTHTHVVNPL